MDAIWNHISAYPAFYGAIGVLAVSTPVLWLFTRTQVAKRHETGLMLGMAIGVTPAGCALSLGFLYGIVFSPWFALGMVILLAPFVVVSAFIGGLIGVFASSLSRHLRPSHGQTG